MKKLGEISTYDNIEIQLSDVVDFFVKWWQVIVLITIASVILGLFYLRNITPLFQAETIISMGKYPTGITRSAVNPSYGFSDVEPPSLLAERIAMPSAFSASVVRACEFETANELVQHVNVVLHNNANSTLKFSVKHDSSIKAANCAQIIFEMIRYQQADLARPYFEKMWSSIAKVKFAPCSIYKDQTLNVEQHLQDGVCQRGSIDLVFAISQFMQYKLEDVGTRMLVPINKMDKQVSPVKVNIILSFAIAGILFGLLLGLIWTAVSSYRRINPPD